LGDRFFHNYLLQSLENSTIDLSQIDDRVVIGWVVMETGELSGVIALEGKSMQLNQFLVQTIADLPGDWQPAELDGKPVRYFMSIPLNFMHKETNFQDIELTPEGYMNYTRY
jgi:glutamate/tyrosine decarboxylase-like PLP-dependent enzyme